ncbi:hypothetical protein [Terrimonas ferruginea]|uniref:hypothetical protein n=1 Tax=Terrimonas ferruginea TaxID=249 RepID=UPI00040D4E2D|nr:hypothetical protein [Terrimonas ferruginea]
MTYLFLLVPLVSAFLGWLFCQWGLTMLVRQLVANRVSLADKAGQFAAQRLEGSLNLEEKLADPSLLDNAMPVIEQHIDEFLNVKLKEEMPMISMFIGNKTTDKLKEVFITQLRQLFPTIMGQLAGNLKERFNVQSLVTKGLTDQPAAELKANITKAFAQPAARIRMAGLIGGLAIGLINVLLFWLLGSAAS